MHGASPIYKGLAPCTSVTCVAGRKWRALLKKNLSYLYLISAPLQPGKTSMWHLMQDLLHWAHKLARNGLVELGCVYNFEYMEKLLELLRATRLKNGISQDYLAVKLAPPQRLLKKREPRMLP